MPYQVSGNNGGARRNFTAEEQFLLNSGLVDPVCSCALTGCLIGCYYGYPVECCVLGAVIGACETAINEKRCRPVSSVNPRPNHIQRN